MQNRSLMKQLSLYVRSLNSYRQINTLERIGAFTKGKAPIRLPKHEGVFPIT
jgi:hypothetical protein